MKIKCKQRSRRRRNSAPCGSWSTAPGSATPGRVISKRGVLPLEDFRTVIDINLVGTFNVLRLTAAAMIDNEPLDGDRGLRDHDCERRGVRRSDRPGGVRGEQGWCRGVDTERGQRPC